MAKKPETKFKEKCLRDLAEIEGIWFFKSQEVSVRGIPDLIICAQGVFIAVELKKDARSRPDALQRYNLTKIEKAWGYAFTAHPGNWSEVLLKIGHIAAGG